MLVLVIAIIFVPWLLVAIAGICASMLSSQISRQLGEDD